MGETDWSILTHAWGAADQTPEHVRRLAAADPAVRRQARGDLANTLAHQGIRFTATAAAVPLLFELLEDPEVAEKDEIIRLLVLFAVGFTERFLPHGIDPVTAFPEAETALPEEAGPEHYDDYDSNVADYWGREAYR